MQVSDAIVVDNSQMDLDEEVAWMIQAIQAKIHVGTENKG